MKRFIEGGNMNSINKSSRVPLYCQLMDIIIENIDNGTIKENDKIPSERELCDQYNISRATVRQAIQEMEKEGYLYREHGKGTFVSPKKLKQELLRFYSFTEEMKKLDKVPTSKVIDFKIISCDEKVARKMNVKVGEMVYKFTRLRLADSDPMMFETSYVCYNRFPGITKEELEKEAMYDIFMKRFDAHISSAEETFQPVLTREDEGKFLKVGKGIPSLKIERITYEDSNIIEYTVSIARGDRFKYHVYLNK